MGVGKAPCQADCQDGGFQAGGGSPFVCAPSVPNPGQGCLCVVHTLLWSGCGLSGLISSSSCFLPSLWVGPFPGGLGCPLPFHLLSAPRETWVGGFSSGSGWAPQPPRGFRALSTSPRGSGCGPWGCRSRDTALTGRDPELHPPRTWPVLGLGCAVALSAWCSGTAEMVTRGGQAALCSWGRTLGPVGYQLGRHQTCFSGTKGCVLRQWGTDNIQRQDAGLQPSLDSPRMCSGPVHA